MSENKFFVSDETPWLEDAWWKEENFAALATSFEDGRMQGAFLAGDIVLPSYNERVLDLGCGFGGHACAFAKAGFETVAMDISAYALEKAFRRAGTEKLPVKFVEEDFTCLEEKEAFGLILLLNDTLGILSERGAEDLVGRCAAALVPNGLIMISGMNREPVVEKLSYNVTPMTQWQECAGGMKRDFAWYDVLLGRYNRLTETMQRGLVRAQPASSLRLYTFTELSRLLSDGGFIVEDVFGDYEGGEYSLVSEKMIVFARKTY